MLKNYWKLVLYGFLVWLVPFLISFLVYPFRDSNRALFESIMAISLVASTVYLYVRYLKLESIKSYQTSVMHGLIWFVIAVLLDLFVFVFGPLHMELSEYIYDIGLTYVVIIIITTGLGLASLIKYNTVSKNGD